MGTARINLTSLGPWNLPLSYTTRQHWPSSHAISQMMLVPFRPCITQHRPNSSKRVVSKLTEDQPIQPSNQTCKPIVYTAPFPFEQTARSRGTIANTTIAFAPLSVEHGFGRAPGLAIVHFGALIIRFAAICERKDTLRACSGSTVCASCQMETRTI